MDISRIEPHFIRENQYVGLGFPNQGYVFWKVRSIENINYEGYTESPGTIAADTKADSARLPIASDSIDNLLEVKECHHLYQVFMGWSPGVVKRWESYPVETLRKSLDVKLVTVGGDFGDITGFESPKTAPSPQTELWIPTAIDVGFAWENPSNVSVDVEISMMIRRIEVRVLRDADLIEKILKGNQPCKLKSLGGIEGSLNYNTRSRLDVGTLFLDATRDEIEAAVA